MKISLQRCLQGASRQQGLLAEIRAYMRPIVSSPTMSGCVHLQKEFMSDLSREWMVFPALMWPSLTANRKSHLRQSLHTYGIVASSLQRVF